MIPTMLATFDLETTDKTPEAARILTAHIGLLAPDGTPGEGKTWTINPGIPIPAEATKINGITDEHVAEHGQDPATAIAIIEAGLDMMFTQGIPVAAFNAAYDFTVLDREIRRHLGRAPIYIPRPVFDPMVLDKAIEPYRKGRRTLGATCERWEVALEDAHTADADATAAGLLALRLYSELEQDPRIPTVTPDLVHTWSIKWRARQQESFADYKRRRGEDVDDIRPEWPVYSEAEADHA